MDTALFICILVFGSASYAVGLRQMLVGKYAPSVFSRAVWLLLAVLTFASTVASGGSKASILLGGVFLLGNASICLLSFWKGTRTWGRLELACLVLLLLGGLIWLLFNAPLVSLGVSLSAHFVGAAPTYRRVWEDPASESSGFWSLFFIASVLAVLASSGSPFRALVFPVYFAFFDGSMTLLSVRKKKRE